MVMVPKRLPDNMPVLQKTVTFFRVQYLCRSALSFNSYRSSDGILLVKHPMVHSLLVRQVSIRQIPQVPWYIYQHWPIKCPKSGKYTVPYMGCLSNQYHLFVPVAIWDRYSSWPRSTCFWDMMGSLWFIDRCESESGRSSQSMLIHNSVWEPGHTHNQDA